METTLYILYILQSRTYELDHLPREAIFSQAHLTGAHEAQIQGTFILLFNFPTVMNKVDLNVN